MGRIPDEEIDRIKREVSVADLARRRGVELNPHGKDLIGLCPFHNDHEPSLVITPEKNLWHCLGACQQGGDVIEWVRKAEGVSFRHAVELLRRHDVALTPGTARAVVKVGTVKKLPSPIERTADDQQALRQAVEFYHQTLIESPEALAYLEKRKIGHGGAVEHFKIGYANRTLGYHLEDKNRQAGKDKRSQLIRLGVYRATGREHFNGCVVVPIVDEQGNITEIYGRRLHNPTHGAPEHVYLPGPHRGIFNVGGLATRGEVILCEALIDALSFWCAGYKNVTASYGVEGFNKDHLSAFKTYRIEKVLIAYDRDEAGDRAAAKLAPLLIEQGCEVFRVEFPLDRDANDFARSVNDPTDAFGQILRGAVWLGKGTRPIADTPPVAPDSAIAQPPAAAKNETPTTPDESPPRELASLHQVDEVFEGRAWRVRGLDKNTTYGVLKVNVRVVVGQRFHMDTVDLANARMRAAFLRAAAVETTIPEAILKDDMRNLLLKLEDIQDALIQKKLQPREPVVELSETERAEALAFLKSPDLLDRIVQDFEALGIVGEQINALTGYLACVSRKFNDPLAVLIQSSSAAGKSALMDAVLSLFPKEEREKFTAITGQALFYMKEKSLKHKILAIVEEQGAEKATYALKLLQSEGRLVIAATGKDPLTGRLVTHEYTVEGPVVILITTTNVEIDEELLNRVLVLTINEDREQTRRIHDLQRQNETLGGILRQEKRADIQRRHQNAQRLLRPLRVSNPYAPHLTFLDTQLRTRRDHPKYLTLIRSIALLHQYQREIKQARVGDRVISYIEVAPADVWAANRIANAVLGRSLDELPPQTRRLLMLLDEMVTKRCNEAGELRADIRFSRRDVRKYTGWSSTAVQIHLQTLHELEYVLPHRGARGIAFVYELLYDGGGKLGEPFCMGLIDAEQLKERETHVYDSNLSDEKANLSGSNHPQITPKSPGYPNLRLGAILTVSKASRALLQNWAKTHRLRGGNHQQTGVVEVSSI